jgi:hypothetical protein
LGQGGGAVAQVVQPDGREPGFVGQLPEVASQPVGRHRVTVESGEHVSAVAVAVSHRGAFGLLGGVVAPQHDDGGAVQGDHALAAGCLGRAEGQVPVVLLQLLADHGGCAVEVDVAPVQPGGLAAVQPA